MSYNQSQYSITIEALSNDDQSKEMICNLFTGRHMCQIKIPITQFAQLKKDGFFSLQDGKMSSNKFVDVPGYLAGGNRDHAFNVVEFAGIDH